MTKLDGIQLGTVGHTDTRSEQGTTLKDAPQEIQDMSPQQNLDTPKEVLLGMSGRCLKVDGVHQQGMT